MDFLSNNNVLKFFFAFVVVFGLIGLTAWLIRRFGQGRIGESTRGRQPRLAVIEAGAVDGRRRLVLIRRDNVEHLLMIGGPSDIVVEQNIVRGQAANGRDVATPRGTGMSDTMPRAVPIPEQNPWPLQPEAAPRPRLMADEAAQWSFEPSPPPPPAPARQTRGDALAGLAAELSARPNGYDSPPASRAPEPARAPLASKPAEPNVAPAADQNLADMAQRLEAALRRPGEPRPAAPRPALNGGAARPQPEAPQVRAEPRHAETTSAEDDKKAFTSLEEEMASLLGRKG